MEKTDTSYIYIYLISRSRLRPADSVHSTHRTGLSRQKHDTLLLPFKSPLFIPNYITIHGEQITRPDALL